MLLCVTQVTDVVCCCQESIVPASSQIQVSLDQVPETHELLKVKKLEEEGEAALETLLGFMGSVHISR